MRTNVTPHQRALNLAAEKKAVREARAAKITTTFVATGERVVKVDGEYAGLIVREKAGWRWMGNPKTYRTFSEAAQYVGTRFLQRKSRPELRRGQIATVKDRADGREIRLYVQAFMYHSRTGRWTIFAGAIGEPYRSTDYEFVSVSDTW